MPMTDDERFMRKALRLSEKALAAGEFPAACVLVRDRRMVASGARSGTRANRFNETDHAEMAALRHLNRQPAPPPPGTLSAYCTLEPCLMCFGALLIRGVYKIVYAYEDASGGGSSCDLACLPPLYRSLSITVIPHVLRAESLRLFQVYFSDPKSAYLRDTPLAAYTLAQ